MARPTPCRAARSSSPSLDSPLQVVFADPHLVVIDKPPGQHTQPPAAGDPRGHSALSGVKRRFGEGVRPVHRLDRDASGLLVLARTQAAAGGLSAQLRDHSMKRTYRARIAVPLPLGTEGAIDAPLRWAGGRCWVDASGAAALTRYRVVLRADGATELEVSLETGRMHQIRVHLAHALGPILGDRKYGGRRAAQLMLRAVRLELVHPNTGAPLRFEVPGLSA